MATKEMAASTGDTGDTSGGQKGSSPSLPDSAPAKPEEALEGFEPGTKPKADTRANDIYDQVEAELKRQGFDPEQVRIDELAQAELEGKAFTPDANHKGIDYQKLVSSLPEDAQKYIANLRADYTRKTQSIAEQRRELQLQLQSVAGSDWDKQLRERAAKEVPDFDPFDQKSYEARIAAEVDRRMDEMMQPLRQQFESKQREMQFQQFKVEHPDFDDMKMDVAKILVSNRNLSAEQAYHIARSRRLEQETSSMRSELEAHRAAVREAGLKIRSGGGRNYSKAPKGLSAYELYQWYAEHGVGDGED